MCVCVCMCGLVAQSCPTLCDLMDCSMAGFSVHGISQARIMEWVIISFSRDVYFGSAGSSLLCRLFSIFREWGVLSTCITRAFHCGGFSCCRTWALRLIDFRRCSPWAHGCDAGAQWLCGMWDPPGTGIESVSPALAGRLNPWTTMEALRFRYFLSAVLGKLLSFLSLLFPVCPFWRGKEGRFTEHRL